jgi:glycosyltransferase involved in cell wall biosynthesis
MEIGQVEFRTRMLVSILIPCFNAERWVAQAIESALAQTWSEKEVIVVDDGSSDGSLEIIKGFGDRVRWEAGPNRGGNVARNRLLELARGEWLQYLDADDYLFPPKIKRQMEFFRDHPNCDVIYSPVLFVNSSEGSPFQRVTAIPEPRDPWILLARWYLPQTGGPLWRRRTLIDVHGWKPDQPCCQEHELYLRLLQSGAEFCYFGECHAAYCYRPRVATVSERNRNDVRRRRLEINARIEEFLRMRGKLTPCRLQALNQARFEIARMVWPEDHALAREIVGEIEQSEPGFVPGPPAARRTYRWMYQLFGLDTAERIAGCKRRLRSQTARLLSHTDMRMLS